MLRRGLVASQIDDAVHDRIFGGAHWTAERAVHDVARFHAHGRDDQPGLLVRHRASQRINKLNEHQGILGVSHVASCVTVAARLRSGTPAP